MGLRTIATVSGLLVALAAPTRADSLWASAGDPRFNWFADNKARRVGDIVTILIKEESKATTDVSQSHSKDSETKAAIEEFRHLCGINKPESDATGDDKGLPAIDWNSSRKIDSKATAESKEALELRVSSVVKEVLPNGNLLIEARREIRHDRDVRQVHLSGIVRPVDIGADNTVLSTNIADARISYEGFGPASRTKHKGWANRLIDFIWPF
jgi:flagellar L-ring protein precursor FlgH